MIEPLLAILSSSDEREKLGKNGRKLYLSNYQFQQMQDGYETKQAYRDCGVKIPEGIAPIAAYCKLWLQLSQDLSDMPIEQIQSREIRGLR